MKVLIKDWTELTVETGTNGNQNIRYQVYVNDADYVVLAINKDDAEIDSVELANDFVLNDESLEELVKQRIEAKE